MSKEHQGKTYIIIRLSALGDVSMTLPYLYDVAKNHPNDHFVLVTQPFMANLLIERPNNLSLYLFDKGEIKSIMQLLGYARRLHFTYPEAIVIDLHNVLRTKIIRMALSTLGHQIFKLRKPRTARKQLLARRREPKVPANLYVPRMIELYQQVMTQSGLSFSETIKTIIPIQERYPSVTIGIAPHAQHQGKRIRSEQCIQLIQALKAKMPDCQIILYGAPGEETEKNQAIVLQSHHQAKPTEAKGLSEEIKEIARLHCMISMDSANQHIAAMVGTPVISIWGATHPAAGFLAFGCDERHCYGIDLDCRPCSIFGNKPCHRGDWACLEQLDMQVVAEMAVQLIQK